LLQIVVVIASCCCKLLLQSMVKIVTTTCFCKLLLQFVCTNCHCRLLLLQNFCCMSLLSIFRHNCHYKWLFAKFLLQIIAAKNRCCRLLPQIVAKLLCLVVTANMEL
jgi:hypothetical protein